MFEKQFCIWHFRNNLTKHWYFRIWGQILMKSPAEQLSDWIQYKRINLHFRIVEQYEP